MVVELLDRNSQREEEAQSNGRIEKKLKKKGYKGNKENKR